MARVSIVACVSLCLHKVLAIQTVSQKAATEERWSSLLGERRSATFNQEKTVADLQAFIKAHGGSASIVLMGDSTVSGMVSDLLDIAPGVLSQTEMVHVTNDRPKGVKFHSKMPIVMPGDEWFLPEALDDPMTKSVIERSQAAVKALHSKNCTWSGGVETFVTTSGDLKGMVVHHWGFIPEYGDSCWDSCYAEAVKALQPNAMMWNIGFHLLNHDFKQSTCTTRHNPSKRHCGDYGKMVTMAMTELSAVVPMLMWRTTNFLCEPLQVKAFPIVESAMVQWNDMSQRELLENNCHADCPEYKGLNCGDWVMSANTTQRMYWASMAVVEKLKDNLKHGNRVHVLDGFKATKNCCERGCEEETADGEHYRGLDKDLIQDLAALLVHGE